MKTLLIVLLVIALAAAAFLTRPSQADFSTYYKLQQTAASPGGVSLKSVFRSITGDSYLSSIVFHDRLLWTSISLNGQTQYIGAFGHWFKESAS